MSETGQPDENLSVPVDLYLKLLDAVRRVIDEKTLEQVPIYLSIPAKAKKVETRSHQASYS